jgi:hypothetical protein
MLVMWLGGHGIVYIPDVVGASHVADNVDVDVGDVAYAQDDAVEVEGYGGRQSDFLRGRAMPALSLMLV